MGQVISFSEIETYMIDLLRYGVLDKKPVNILPSSQVDWDKMMDVAAAQGLLAWVWDGICKLPKEYRPPRQQSINWGLSAQEIWENFEHHKQVLKQIIDIYAQNNIKLLLFKGIALSEFYIKPESRPSGDIDFYLFDDYERGNQLLARKNVSVTNKRTGFDYEGVHIENHRLFLNTYTKMQVNVIRYLEETLGEAKYTKDNYYVFGAIPCVVYQVMHFIAHIDDITSPPSLRFVVDFGMTLRHYINNIDSKELKIVLERLELMDLFCLMVVMVEDIMGEDFRQYHFQKVQEKNLYALFELIFRRPQGNVSLMDKTFHERLGMYFSRYRQLDGLFKFLPVKRKKFVLKSVKELFSISFRRLFSLTENVSIIEGVKSKMHL